MLLSLIAILLAAPAKPAKPAPAPPKPAPAAATSDDPLSLPRKDAFAPSTGPSVGIIYDGLHVSSGGASQTGHELGVAGTYRVNPTLFVDGGLMFDLSPDAGFGRIGAGGTYFVMPNLGVMANASLYRYADISGSKVGFALGGGVNFTYPINPQFTFFTRRPWIIAPLGSGLSSVWADDILTLDFNDFASVVTLGVPLGVYATLAPNIGAAFRTGLRHAFVSGGGTTFIPLYLDGIVSVAKDVAAFKNVSVIATIGLPGSTDGYGDLFQWTVVLQGQM